MKHLLSYILLTIILLTTLSMSASFAYAQDEKPIYVPITENFISLKNKEIPAPVGGTANNCQELFRQIQQKPNLNQRSFIEDNKLWEQGKFPECFVVGKTGIGIISNYLTMIYQWLAGLVGGVAILMIIVGSVQIATGGGDQNNVTEGKTKIMQALAGLVVLFLSGLILYTINPTFYS